MKKVILGLLISFGFAYAEVDYSQFVPMTFSRFEQLPETKEQTLGPKKLYFDMQTHPYSMRVSYTGNTRKLPEPVKKFLTQFGTSIQNPTFTAMYEDEIEVKEGAMSHWVPVQKKVLPYLAQELRPSDTFEIYVRYLGSTESSRVFALIEFAASSNKSLSRK